MSALIRLGESVFPVVLDAAWKATALMGVTLVLARALGKKRPVARYSLWVYCLTGILILPLTSFLARDRRIPLLPPKQLAARHSHVASRDASSGRTEHPATEEKADGVETARLASPGSSDTEDNNEAPIAASAVVNDLPVEDVAAESLVSMMDPDGEPRDGSSRGSAHGAMPATGVVELPVGSKQLEDTGLPRMALSGDQESVKGGLAFSWQGLLGLAYLAACGVFVARLLLAMVSVAQVRRSCSCVSDAGLSELFEAAKKCAGVTRGVRLRVGENIASPVAIGVLRPTILLPRSLSGEMPSEQLQPVLIHELAHVQLGDYAAKILQRLVECFLFFHPLVWLVGRELHRLREDICDNWVLDHNQDDAAYARALTELAGRNLRPRLNRFASLGLFTHCARIQERIERILSSSKRPAAVFRLKTALILLCVSLAVVGSLSFVSLSARALGEAPVEKKSETPVIVEGDELTKVPFLKTAARYARYELPPLPVLLMSDGRAMVPAQRIWSDTGVKLEEGQIVSVSAVGQVRGCNQPPTSWAFGPWGPEGTMCGEPEDADKKACALIGKIEDGGDRKEFYIGNELTFRVPLAGTFYLGVADLFHMDNEAAFVAEVKVDGEAVNFNTVFGSKAGSGVESENSSSGETDAASPSPGDPDGESSSSDVSKLLSGKRVFHGTYNHRSRGQPYGTSEQWVAEDDQGALTVVTKLRSETYIALGDKDHRVTEYKILPEEEAGYRLEMAIREGKVTYKQRMPGEEEKTFEIPVPEGSLFDPNTRPDPYCATVILLKHLALNKGESKEVLAYDRDNAGVGMGTYRFRIQNRGKEEVNVPAGKFETNHLVLTQLTTGDTWYKKAAMHVTDFWAMDNGVIVKILRHREPYEVELQLVQEANPSFWLQRPVVEAAPARARPPSALNVTIAKQPGQVGPVPDYDVPERIEAEGGNRYVVRDASFRDGQRLYTDRTYTLVGVAEKYQGLTYIQTANDDKVFQDEFAFAFEVNVPVKVYVAYDDRLKTTTPWLETFEDTGDDFISSDTWKPVYSIYAKRFPKGKVTLGPNCGVMLSSMYLVILEELPEGEEAERVAAPRPETEQIPPTRVTAPAPALQQAPEGYATGINGVRFMKTLPVYKRQELPPMPVLVMDDGRAIVPAQRIWSDTGLDVNEGQTMTFAADGQVRGCHAPMGDWAMGPWGPEGTLAPATPYQGNRVCALIGKIEGADKVEEFYIGKGLTLNAPSSGRLYLGVSDIFHIDNEGAFVVDVKIEGKRLDFSKVEFAKPALGVREEAERAPAAPKFGKRAVVAADGSGDTTSIQEGIDGVDEHGVISIKPGAYRENLVISKAVSIEGAGRDVTRIETTSNQSGISVQRCKDVGIRGLTITCGTSLGEQSGLVLMEVQDAALSVEECNLLWAQFGITVSGNSNAWIEKCLVAGIWGTGVAIGQDASASITNCEVRNCYHRCITVRSKGEVRIENNLISGSAWHGIRYDHCSPSIVGNVLNNHARCGIYASGSGEPLIANNLFLRNDLSGIATWGRTNPVVRNNTFVGNKREALGMDVLSQPVVENNVFFANETAALRFYTEGSRQFSESSPAPVLSHNLLWKNKEETPPPPRPKEEVIAEHKAKIEGAEKELAELKGQYGDGHPMVQAKRQEIQMLQDISKQLEGMPEKSPELSFSDTALRVDPLFEDEEADNYNLRPDSPARGSGKDGADVGAALTISVKSQYPITPEEKLIVPDGDSRDFQLWKTGVVSPPVQVAKAEAPGPSPIKPAEVIIDVTKAGEFLISGSRKAAEEVNELLQKVGKEQPDARVIVRAHREAPYKSVLKVLEACEKAGISDVSLATPSAEPEIKKPQAPSPAPAAEVKPGPTLLRTFYHTGIVQSVAFSPDGKAILAGSGDGTVRLWDARTGDEIRTFSGHVHEVHSVAFSPDGKQILTGSCDNTAKLWNTATGEVIRTFSGHTDHVEQAAFSPDGKKALTASSDKTARLWEVGTGDEICAFSGHADRLDWAAFSPDGKKVVTGSYDGTAKLWDGATGNEILTFTGNAGAVHCAVFSPDGRYVLSGNHNGTADLWDAKTGQRVRAFHGDGGPVFSAAFSPEGEAVLTSGGFDQTAKLWSTATGAEICTLAGHTGLIDSVALSPDGTMALTGSYDQTVKLWKIEASPAPEVAAAPPPVPGGARAEIPINLDPYVNAPLTGFHNNPGNDVTVPKGKQQLGDVSFQIGEGVIWLRGQDTQDAHRPDKVEGIEVGLEFAKLHFLHATCFAVPDGTQIASYIVHYEDGTEARIPVVFGVHLRDWWAHPGRRSDLSEGKIVWRGRNEYATGNWDIPICLYSSVWENPHPGKLVTAMDFVSAVTQCSPYVVAITAEMEGPAPAADVKKVEKAEAGLDEKKGYERAFRDLYDELGRNYPAFGIKGIDWNKVGEELLPRAKEVKTDEEFGLLCMELVARLEDSHAYLMNGTAQVPSVEFPRYDPGFACLIDDRGKPAVYYVDKGGPADAAGVKVGMTVVSVNGEDAGEHMQRRMKETKRYSGYSSDRYLVYHAAQWLGRQIERGAEVEMEMHDVEGKTHRFKCPATYDVRYLPRLPVPIPGISDSADVSWTMLENNIGLIYVRRIRDDLIPRLDQAVEALKNARGLIMDVRGNSGGGFDASRALRNFSLDDGLEPQRPRFKGPMALLTDARCVSAGEGWASWFIANKRAKVFGETTAGASSRKTVYTLTNGLFKVQYPVKAYTGFLDRPIERRGLEPDVSVKQNAKDLVAGRDTVLEAAKQYLLEQTPGHAAPVAPVAAEVAPSEVEAKAEKYSDIVDVNSPRPERFQK